MKLITLGTYAQLCKLQQAYVEAANALQFAATPEELDDAHRAAKAAYTAARRLLDDSFPPIDIPNADTLLPERHAA